MLNNILCSIMLCTSIQSYTMAPICSLVPVKAVAHTLSEADRMFPPYDMYYVKSASETSLGSSLAPIVLIGSLVVGSITLGYLASGRPKMLADSVFLNRPWLARALLKVGANPYASFEDEGKETTVIHEVIKYRNIQTLRLFLSHSGDVDIQDSDGNTPLHIASINDAEDAPEYIQTLYEHGACIQATDIVGNSPLHLAVQSHAHSSTEELLKLQADVNAQDFYGNTPLHDAALSGNLYGIILLLQHGAQSDILANGDVTAYDIALQNGRQDAANMLVNTQAERRYILALDDAVPKNPLLDRHISAQGTNILEKLFNREIGM